MERYEEIYNKRFDLLVSNFKDELFDLYEGLISEILIISQHFDESWKDGEGIGGRFCPLYSGFETIGFEGSFHVMLEDAVEAAALIMEEYRIKQEVNYE